MISCTKLLCGTMESGDKLRYGAARHRRPIVVWNMTKQCNLACRHCYINAKGKPDKDELSTAEAKKFIETLKEFEVPVLLFSGGEPLMREDIFELGQYAIEKNIRTVISTNGTLITESAAQKIKQIGFSYVGISLDGLESTNDKFRGQKGAFADALKGIRNCLSVGQKVGLRFTINRSNHLEVGDIFKLIEQEKIPRACFYHLVYIGRGESMKEDVLTSVQSRAVVDLIFDKSEELYRKGMHTEILTVDNHCDGPYLYMKLKSSQPERAEEIMRLLKWNGGNSSGIGIACVDNLGEVHADQFWQHYSFGNVRTRKFGDIWMDTADPVMAGLKDRKKLLKGRCSGQRCRRQDICNGNFRVRAEAVHGDIWAEDPGCYLTDEECQL